MNLLKIIENLDLEKIDQEEFLKPAMRRGLFKKASEFSLKAAMASIPFALFALPKIASASTQDAITDTLNFALKLEFLEADFYDQGIKAGIVAATDAAIINQIYKHEAAHVALLQSVLKTNADPKPTFDFTAGGAFPDALTNYQTFLALAQGFEDAGVRAYKGQAGNLLGTDTLTVALQIHSVEARHASEIRRLRGQKGWISQKAVDVAALGPIYGAGATGYPAEDNTTHAGLDLNTLNLSFSKDNLTESFDEPLDKATVLSVAGMFIKK